MPSHHATTQTEMHWNRPLRRPTVRDRNLSGEKVNTENFSCFRRSVRCGGRNHCAVLLCEMDSIVTFSVLLLLLMVIFPRTSNQFPIFKSATGDKGVNAEVRTICRVLDKSHQDLTLVFVLRASKRYRSSFSYLWRLSRAHVYLSHESFVLKPNEREIVISWERDYTYLDRPLNAYWSLDGACGYRNCSRAWKRFQLFYLENRVLIQIRELTTEQFEGLSPKRFRGYMRRDIGHMNYLRRFRSTFLVVRMHDSMTLHSTNTVRRTGRVIGKQIMRLTVEEFEEDHARNVFKPTVSRSNDTGDFSLEFFAISFPDGGLEDRISFNYCHSVSSLLVYPCAFSSALSLAPSILPRLRIKMLLCSTRRLSYTPTVIWRFAWRSHCLGKLGSSQIYIDIYPSKYP